MDAKRALRISKFLSRHLRHSPKELGLTLEPGGWVPIASLLTGAARHGFRFTRDELNEVVRTNDKQRFAIDEPGLMIRANQGHSTEVDLRLEPADPPTELFHGTADRNLPAILRDGLKRMARHHVHLSPDMRTATKVGQRHGRPVVLVIAAFAMRAAGYAFFRSTNGVWLVDEVPPQYLRALEPEN